MEDQIIGTLTINTSVVIPHPNNVRLKGNYSVKDLDYRHKTVKLHSYFGVERSDCAKLKSEFLAHNRQFDEDDLSFVFQVTEYF
jgi:hypothetical protein